MRLFWEVDNNKIGKKNKWVLSDKAGGSRKWYGNIINVMNWENDGYEIRNFKDENGKLISRPQNIEWLYKEGVSWGKVTASKHTFRYRYEGYAFNDAAPTLFPITNILTLKQVLAMLNTKVGDYLLDISGNTINATVGSVEKMPSLIEGFSDKYIVDNNISISREDWDAHETSWDFEENEIVGYINEAREIPLECTFKDKDGKLGSYSSDARPSFYLESLYENFKTKWTEEFVHLLSNEEELNRQFIEIYGLEDELKPDVPPEEITILQQGEISIEDKKIVWHPDVVMKQFISYAIGCMMGRYRLDKKGLCIAHPNPSAEEIAPYEYHGYTFEIDDDGIIPLMSKDSRFDDNCVNRLTDFVKLVFGEETLTDNMNFLEESLGKSVEQYLIKDFWRDHKKMYQNRPIYWLFSSKKGAFQVIAYMHRMNKYTAENIRNKYLLPHIEYLRQELAGLDARVSALTTQERKQYQKLQKDLEECMEYHDRLHSVADQQIDFDLDDGVVVNYAKFGDVLAKLK